MVNSNRSPLVEDLDLEDNGKESMNATRLFNKTAGIEGFGEKKTLRSPRRKRI